MSAIVENNAFKALEQLLENHFDPKSKQMRDFRDALIKSNISNLFFGMPGAAAKVVKAEVQEAEKKRGRKKATDTDGAPKEKRVPNAYMLFLADKREEIKQFLLEENATLKGKELQNAITRKAGEIWKASSEDDKKPYVSKNAELKAARLAGPKPDTISETGSQACCSDHDDSSSHIDPPQLSDEETIEKADDEEPSKDDAGRTFSEEFGVWVDETTKLCYPNNDEDSGPIGQIKAGKFQEFNKK